MIDLHCHTDESDGSLGPEELVHEAARNGLQALAITDHDTLAGYDKAVPAAAEAGIELICGVELSTRMAPSNGSARYPSVHLLGYFLDKEAPSGFREWLVEMQHSRHRRNLALAEKLRSLGMDITIDEVRAEGRNLTGRPHFAQVLLRKGYVRNLQEAFDEYLGDEARAAVPRQEPGLAEGVRRIAQSGGMAVLAHPVRLKCGQDYHELSTLLRELKSQGLAGIEVFHSEHEPSDVELYSLIAKELRLASTGGSDFHGAAKPSIELGVCGRHRKRIPKNLLQSLQRVCGPSHPG